MSKLHSDAFTKLEHVLLSFEYAFFIRVWSLHLGMYAICIWVCSFHLGIIFFIEVCLLHLSMLFSFGYALCI